MPNVTVEAEPAPLSVDLDRAALVIIDMQRDFLEAGGFGEALGNDVSRYASGGGALPGDSQHRARPRNTRHSYPRRSSSRSFRRASAQSRARRSEEPYRCGRANGPHPRPRRPGHDIIPELYPVDGEPVIDKPGKGAFYRTDLELMLRNRGIDTLLVCGVTTEVCVNTTVREAKDRGFRCIVLSDCCASYFPDFHDAGLAMIKAQGGIFGSVTESRPLIDTLTALSFRSAKRFATQ